MARLQALSPSDDSGDVETAFRKLDDAGFKELPNSARTLARCPRILDAAIELVNRTILEGDAPRDLKLMVAHLASRAHGCMYCSAHTAALGANAEVPREKIAALWEFEQSPLFSEAEKAALRIAVAGASVPNAITDDHVEALLRHFDEGQAVEIIAAMAVMGFWNRWNDSLATELEPGPRRFAEANLAPSGWTIGVHGENAMPEVQS